MLLVLSACGSPERLAPASSTLDPPTRRSLDLLAREVPAWRAENGCFSCHDNGDGAAALFAAVPRGRALPESLAESTAWLAHPERWQSAGTGAPFEDDALARLQFAVALLEANRAGVVPDPAPLRAAAEMLARDQADEGHFLASSATTLAAPVTWGPILGTVLARRVLYSVDPRRFSSSIERADRYLQSVTAERVPDAAALLLWAADGGPVSPQRRAASLRFLSEAQAPDGGWGPYRDSAVEAFDTALALMALTSIATPDPSTPELSQRIERGRRFLVERQLADGSWIETTRPLPYESRAQRLSTVAWVTRALLATRR